MVQAPWKGEGIHRLLDPARKCEMVAVPRVATTNGDLEVSAPMQKEVYQQIQKGRFIQCYRNRHR